MDVKKLQRALEAINAVVSDADLVALILACGIGPTSFAAASLVCRTWAYVCRTDERVLRGAAQYQGGLTKSAIMRLFALSSQQADALPRAMYARFRGGMYYQYRSDAIDTILAIGGMEEWRKRRSRRTEQPAHVYGVQFSSPSLCLHRAFEQEQRLHARSQPRRSK